MPMYPQVSNPWHPWPRKIIFGLVLTYLSVVPPLRERLGDAKDQVREQAQHLIQTLMTDCVSSPQVFLDKLLEPCLNHKNWRVKEQGLLCLSRTLS